MPAESIAVMPRPIENRYVQQLPPYTQFKPAGVPAASLPEVVLPVDQYEAIRLVDFEGMYQEKAAEVLGVSRQTVGRMLEEAPPHGGRHACPR